MSTKVDPKRAWPIRSLLAVWAGVVWLFHLIVVVLRFIGWLGGTVFLVFLVLLLWFLEIPSFDSYLELPGRAEILERKINAQELQINALEQRIGELIDANKAQSVEIERMRRSLTERSSNAPAAQGSPQVQDATPVPQASATIPLQPLGTIRKDEVVAKAEPGWSWFQIGAVVVALVLGAVVLAARSRRTGGGIGGAGDHNSHSLRSTPVSSKAA